MISTPVVVVVLLVGAVKVLVPRSWRRHIKNNLHKARGHVALWLRRQGFIGW